MIDEIVKIIRVLVFLKFIIKDLTNLWVYFFFELFKMNDTNRRSVDKKIFNKL